MKASCRRNSWATAGSVACSDYTRRGALNTPLLSAPRLFQRFGTSDAFPHQDQILAQYGSGAWAYALPDHLGSVRQLTNAGGQVTLAQGYDLFGVLFEAAGLGASPFGYTGEWWGSYTELLFLRARYHDPGTERLQR